MATDRKENQNRADDKPPLFRLWSSWYWLVAATLIGQIILYFLITKSFS